jgi:pimeloyl-ACP methyl ester carboxylesterase
VIPLLYLPGLLENGRGFQHQVEGLRAMSACTVADLTGEDTMPGLAAAALAQAPEGRFALASHSLGGYVALEILRQAPGRVSALALLNTQARPDSPESTENRRRLMKLAETDLRAVVDALLPKLVHPQNRDDPAIVDTIVGMALDVGKDAFMRQQRAIIGRIDSRPHLSAIGVPTLVVAGLQDAIMPVELLEELAKGIPRAELVVLEDCGHCATLEQPHETTAHLKTWLNQLEAT